MQGKNNTHSSFTGPLQVSNILISFRFEKKSLLNELHLNLRKLSVTARTKREALSFNPFFFPFLSEMVGLLVWQYSTIFYY